MRNRIITIVITLVLILSCLPIPSSAIELKFAADNYLYNANASFKGETNGDQAGGSVAANGDVNGDGYNDILIGANANDEAHTAAGQTYLIFGTASGVYYPGYDLSDANASFHGEGNSDNSGMSVAFAGDVDNDGYDDILIGSFLNDDGGSDAGQIYLIFGGAAGWSNDTDLSNADASYLGEAASHNAGRALAGVGDVNNDGYDDFVIGVAGGGGAGRGEAYLILGKAAGWSMDVDLSNADASYIGESGTDRAGCKVAGVGDVNGDGFDDFLIGAYGDDDGGANAGQAYLILGKAAGWTMDNSLSTADASFIGEVAGDQLGRNGMSGGGDINGDGFDDILIGADGNDEGGNAAGQVYIIFGKSLGWAMDVDISNADASFIGEMATSFAGGDIASDGEINGDIYNDILIASRGYDGQSGGEGKTYLILGKASGWSMDTNLSTANASFLGEVGNDYSGSVSWGDFNGDSYDDIVVGAWASNAGGVDSGKVYLISDKNKEWRNLKKVDIADASFWGAESSGLSGYSVAGAGDVNGDGYDDLMFGSYRDSDGGTNAGQTFIVFGSSSGWAMDTNLSNADASFIGETADDWSGYSVAGVGDVNGDDYDDILIGAYKNDEGGTDAGQTYLIFGNASGWAMDTDLNDSDASFIGEANNDESGKAVAGAGDVNGDGYSDFLIAAAKNDDGVANGGKTYLFFGAADGWSMNMSLSKANASFVGEGNNDQSGISIAGVHDVDGDNFDDFLIGAYGNDDGGDPAAGQSYLILGGVGGWVANKSLANSDASFQGEDKGDWSGYSVGGAGDVDGDGYDDILIGAIHNDEGGYHAGQVYLILGMSAGWSMDTDLANADASFWGERKSDELGSEVTGAGDIDGDGYDDIIMGAPKNNNNIAGKTYVMYGKSSGWAMDVNLSNADLGIMGEYLGDASGCSIAGVGDANGEGFDDFMIGAYGNDEGGQSSGQTYLILSENNTQPFPISSVKVYFSSSYATEITYANLSDEVYIELIGTDGDPTRIDIAVVEAIANVSSPVGITLKLFETGPNTGIYRTSMTIEERSHSRYGWLKALGGETVTFTSRVDPSKTANIQIDSPVMLRPLVDNTAAIEDQVYDEHYWDGGTNSVLFWKVKTNASWLKWNTSTETITGTARNTQVGSYWVDINVSNGVLSSDSTNFTLVVSNNPPNITTTDITSAIEDVLYMVTYASDDDPSTTWSWSSPASWLAFDTGTKVLSGTPDNQDVGSYNVQITVNDGNGGTDTNSFNLKVNNVIPIISGVDNISVIEDSPYSNNYNCTDDGMGIMTWAVDSKFDFLSIDNNGVLSGTPDNSDVGVHTVNVTVNDGNNGIGFRNFTLTVSNLAPSIITGTDLTTAQEDSLYSHDYDSDEDGQGSINWSMVTDSDFLSINSDGLLSGTPDNGDVGSYSVEVIFDDGHGGTDQRSFTLVVSNIDPVINTTDVTSSPEDQLYLVDYDCDDEGQGNTVWSLTTDADFLSLDTNGVLSGTPDNLDVGTYSVLMSVDDGNGGSASSQFTLEIVNIRPVIMVTPPYFVDEDSEYQVAFNSTDDGLGTITWHLEADLGDWLSIDPSTGVLSGIPENDDVGEHSVNVGVDDGNGGHGWVNFTLTVNNTNDAPTITSIPVKNGTAFMLYSYQVMALDVDVGDVLVYIINDGPDGMWIDAASGMLEWIPNGDQIGKNMVQISVDDGTTSVSQTFEIDVQEVSGDNKVPVFTTEPLTEIKVETRWVYEPEVTDDDKDDIVTIEFALGPTGMSFNGDVLSWTPSVDQLGDHTVRLIASDGKAQVSQEFVVKVSIEGSTNNVPVITAIKDVTVQQGNKVFVSVKASDIDGDVLQYSIKDGPGGVEIDDKGRLTWKTGKGDKGTYTVVVKVSDGKLSTTEAFQIKVTVESVDDPGSSGLTGMLPILAIVIVVVMVVIILLVMLRRKAGGKKEEQGPKQPDEGQSPPPPTTPPPEYAQQVPDQTGYDQSEYQQGYDPSGYYQNQEYPPNYEQ